VSSEAEVTPDQKRESPPDRRARRSREERERDLRQLVGRTVAERYRIEALLGTGGMGAVYEAVHTRLGEKRFAVKMLHPAIAQDAEVFRRFRQEAMVVFWKQLADGIRKVPRLLGGKEVD